MCEAQEDKRTWGCFWGGAGGGGEDDTRTHSGRPTVRSYHANNCKKFQIVTIQHLPLFLTWVILSIFWKLENDSFQSHSFSKIDQNREVQEGRLRSIQTNNVLSKNQKGYTRPMIGHTTQGQTNTDSLIGWGLRHFFHRLDCLCLLLSASAHAGLVLVFVVSRFSVRNYYNNI